MSSSHRRSPSQARPALHRALSLGILTVVALTRPLIAAPPEEEPKPKEQDKPKITISKETTYITEPLRPDGYPDYVAALNERMSEGVTPENNAAVLLSRALGPTFILRDDRKDFFRRDDRKDFFKLLGIEPPPETGDYFVNYGAILDRWKRDHPDASSDEAEKFEGQFSAATERPWKANEFPVVAKWVAMNEQPLKLVRAATQRKKCYFPLVAPKSETPVLVVSSRHEVDPVRALALCLHARAMLRLGQKDTEGAWDDALCCHRLARLLDEGPFVHDTLDAYAIEDMACCAAAAVFHYDKPSAKTLQQMKADLGRLQPFKNPSAEFDIVERFITLDAMCSLARGAQAGNRAEPFVLPPLCDYDAVLKMGNEWYDKLAAAARIEEGKQRRAAVGEVVNEFSNFAKEKRSLGSLALDIGTKGVQKGDAIHLAAKVLELMLPAPFGLLGAQARCEMYQQLQDVAISLALYRSDAGHYPEKLDELVPKYLAAVPTDMFLKQPTQFRYRREGDAYVLWTAGQLGKGDPSGPSESGEFYDMILRPVPVKADNPK
jgi:hypothetical protein